MKGFLRHGFLGLAKSISLLLVLLVFCFFSTFSLVNAVNWPLRVSANGPYLEDQSGVPFPVVGEAAWSLVVGLNQTDLATYLDDRQVKGFNAIIVNAIEHKFAINAPADAYGNVPFTNGESDWSVRTEAYWANLDYVLNQAKARDMVVFLAPAYLGYGCGDEGWCADMQAQTDAAMTSYGQFIGARYASQGNIIWLDGGDANCSLYTNACSRVNAVANGIKATNTYLHTAASVRGDAAMDDYAHIIDFNTAYPSNTTLQSVVQTQYQRSGALPFTTIEATYEDSNMTQVGLQGEALGSYLGGALLGYFFGNDYTWCFAPGWNGSNGIGSAGSISMGYIGQLISSRKWYLLVPDYSNTVVKSAKGSGVSYKATARTSDGATVMVWNPNTTNLPITIDMTKVSGSSAQAQLWNPVDNTFTPLGVYATTGTHNFSPSAGTVLILDTAGDTNIYLISASAGTGGTISPSGSVVVNSGSSQTFTISANNGYRVSNVKVDGTSVGAVSTYTFNNVTTAHTIAATFIANTYTISASAGTGGTISPSGSVVVNSGSSKTFTISANNGYRVSNVKVDGTSVGAVSTYTFNNVTTAHTIAATFIANTYTISASAGTGGTISPSGSVVVNSGSSKTFIISPNRNYRVTNVTVDGASVGAVSMYTFSNVTAAHGIQAYFDKR